MGLEVVLDLLGRYCFPVVMCLLVWWDNRRLEDRMSQMIATNTEAMSANASAVRELTTAIRSREV